MKRDTLLDRATVAAVVLALVGLAAQPRLLAALTQGTLTPLRVWVGKAAHRAEAQLQSPADLQQRLDALAAQNAALAARLAEQDAAEALAEAIAEMPQLPGLTLTPVWAAGSDIAAGEGLLWVAPAGEARPGTPVLDSKGNLLGKVLEAAGNAALVEPLTAPGSAVSCWVGSHRESGLLEGGGTRCTLSGLPRACRAVEGDLVVTNGLGGIYPAGLPVGRVGDPRLDSTGKGCTAKVELFREEQPTLLYLAEAAP